MPDPTALAGEAAAGDPDDADPTALAREAAAADPDELRGRLLTGSRV